MSRSFNDLVSIDHLHLNGLRVIHIMDSATRYSTGAVVESTAMPEAIAQFESQGVSSFWYAQTLLYDPAFDNVAFKAYLLSCEISARLISPCQHIKNVLESKHRIIRDIFLRLTAHANIAEEQSEETQAQVQHFLVQKATCISNDLYGKDVASANEPLKGYTRPIQCGASLLSSLMTSGQLMGSYSPNAS